MKKKLIYTTVLVAALGLAGCSSTSSKLGQAGSANGNGAHSSGAGQLAGFKGVDKLSSQQRKLLNDRTYYFAFDSSIVDQKDMPAVEAQARYLAANPNAHIVLEGNTDERGSREYNVGLGERRDNSVEQILLMNGARKNQIKKVSYGAEKPAVLGHSETAYAKNRRVELAYRNH